MNSNAPFPVRPKIELGESTKGWVWRTYTANGHTPPALTGTSISKVHTSLKTQLDSQLSLERLLIEHWRNLAPYWYQLSALPRICPLCVANSGIHLLEWNLPLVSACAVHGYALRNRCNFCQHKITWNFLSSGWRCRCGANFTAVQNQDAPKSQVRFSRVLAQSKDYPKASGFFCYDQRYHAIQHIHFRVRDVYEIIVWIHDAKCNLQIAFAHPQAKKIRKSFTPSSKNASRACSILLRPKLFVLRALKAIFQSVDDVIVDAKQLTGWSVVEELLSQLHGMRNPFASLIAQAIEQQIDELETARQEFAQYLFHPRLTLLQQHRKLRQLDRWWKYLATQSCPRWDVHTFPTKTSDHADAARGFSPVAVNLLNALFAAAERNISPKGLSAWIKHRPPPRQLDRPKDTIKKLKAYFSFFEDEELFMAKALVDTAIQKHEQRFASSNAAQ